MIRIYLTCLLAIISTTGYCQAQKNSSSTLAISDTFFTFNGKPLTGHSLLAENAFKIFGKPEAIDTFNNAKNVAEYQHVVFNKYVSKGFSLTQGNMSNRINKLVVFVNPVAEKIQFVDYVTNGFKGKLTVLGVAIDTSTSVDQLLSAFGKDNIRVYSKFADMTIFDRNTQARLAEVNFVLLPDKRIEYFSVKYFLTHRGPKLKLDYSNGVIKINNIVIDTVAGKSIALKKLLGSPNAVIPMNYSVDGRGTYRVYDYWYEESKGIVFTENPANNSIERIDINFLMLRKKTELYNPLLDIKFNGKVFNPEKTSSSGIKGIGTWYNFDSARFENDRYNKKHWMYVYLPGGAIEFTGPDYGQGAYAMGYRLSLSDDRPRQWDRVQIAHPDLLLKNGSIILKLDGKSTELSNLIEPAGFFDNILGSPTKYQQYFNDYGTYGIRIYKNKADSSFKGLDLYLQNHNNAKELSYKGTPYGYRGKIYADDKPIGKTVSQLMTQWPEFGFKLVHSDSFNDNYLGSYKEFNVVIGINKTTGTLALLSIGRKS